jgi:GAF domain-containing protein
LVEALLGLSHTSVADGNVELLLGRIAELATVQLGGCAMAGVTLMGENGPTTAVFTDQAAPDIDAAQYRTGSGPCLDAFRDGTILRIDDTNLDDRWPEFCVAAKQHGVRSTLSLPLRTENEPIGALNLYSRTEGNFADNEQIATVFVTHAAGILANAQAYWAAHTLSEQLQEALTSRAVIEQAKGVLMGKHRCDADQAFELLKTESQAANRKLRDVAADMVADIAGP